MRKVLLLTVILLCAFNLIASCQESFQVSTPANGRIRKSHSGNPSANSFYFFSQDNSLQKSVIITRLVENKVAWSKVYSPDNFLYVAGRLPYVEGYATNDNGCIATITTFKDSCKIYGLKCDSTGKVQWSFFIDKTSEVNYYGFDTRICEAKDGSIYVVVLYGSIYYDVIKLNKFGKLVWERRIKYANSYGSGIGAVTASPDNGLVVALKYIACEAYCIFGDIVRFDSNGNFLWDYAPSGESLQNFEPFFVGFEGNDLKLFATISTYTPTLLRIMIATIRNSKDSISAVATSNDFFSLKYYLKQNNDEYVKGKELTDGHFIYHTWIINPDWSLMHNYTNNNQSFSIDKYNEANKLCPDFKEVYFNKRSDSVKLQWYSGLPARLRPNNIFEKVNVSVSNYNFKYKVICSSATAITSTVPNKLSSDVAAITLSPNPTSNILNINGLKGTNNVSVVSMNGKILSQYNSAGSSVNLNIASLKPGTYLLKINDGKQMQIKKFIKN